MAYKVLSCKENKFTDKKTGQLTSMYSVTIWVEDEPAFVNSRTPFKKDDLVELFPRVDFMTHKITGVSIRPVSKNSF